MTAIQDWHQNDSYNLYTSEQGGLFFTLVLENVVSSGGPEGNVMIDLYEVGTPTHPAIHKLTLFPFGHRCTQFCQPCPPPKLFYHKSCPSIHLSSTHHPATIHQSSYLFFYPSSVHLPSNCSSIIHPMSISPSFIIYLFLSIHPSIIFSLVKSLRFAEGT